MNKALPAPQPPPYYLFEVRTITGDMVTIEMADFMVAIARDTTGGSEAVAEHFRLEGISKLARIGGPETGYSPARDAMAAAAAAELYARYTLQAECMREFGTHSPPPPHSLGEDPEDE
jgi:hypothetical protein